ncbi:MAG: GNAT family N-acetyltransferase [Microcoleaceae cyanobacterium]
MILPTQRLIIRDWHPGNDAIAAFKIYGDPAVMHYIREPENSIETVQTYLEKRVARDKHRNNGTGSWAVIEQQTAELIGAILLQQLPDNQGNLTQDFEIGWHFQPSSWGKGFATEAAERIIDYGFETLHLPILYAVVKPENQRSIRVTQRLNMEPLGHTNQYYGVDLLLFRLTSGHT